MDCSTRRILQIDEELVGVESSCSCSCSDELELNSKDQHTEDVGVEEIEFVRKVSLGKRN